MLINGPQVCAGLDPAVNVAGSFFINEQKQHGQEEFLHRWGMAVLEALKGKVNAVKFQSAYYEARGAIGLKVLQRLIAYAKGEGIYVILDAKRGDIGSTMSAYGSYAFDQMNADSLTVAPYLGVESLQALRPWTDNHRDLIMVWLSSNIKNNNFQKRLLAENGEQSSIAGQLITDAPSKAGLVIGAQRFSELNSKMAEAIAGRLVLVPGLGAQGGAIEECWRHRLEKWPAPVLLSYSRGIHGDLSDSDFTEKFPSWASYTDYVSEKTKKTISAPF